MSLFYLGFVDLLQESEDLMGQRKTQLYTSFIPGLTFVSLSIYSCKSNACSLQEVRPSKRHCNIPFLAIALLTTSWCPLCAYDIWAESSVVSQ